MLSYIVSHSVGLREYGGFPMFPAVFLDPLTLVDVQGSIDPKEFGQFNTTVWIRVKVEQGPHAGTEGYLPATAIVDVPGELAYTPVKYGKVAQNPGSDPVTWEDICIHCHQPPDAHVLPETSYGTVGDGVSQVVSKDLNLQTRGTKQDAERLKITLESERNRFKAEKKMDGSLFVSPSGMMLGVLHVRGEKPWASHSGRQSSQAFRAVVESLGFMYAEPTQTGKVVLTRGFQPATSKDVYVTVNGNKYGPSKVQGFEYQCAAPRLIQAALAEGDYPIAMTEIMFKPQGDSHGHTIPSCNKCRARVPYMLCNV